MGDQLIQSHTHPPRTLSDSRGLGETSSIEPFPFINCVLKGVDAKRSSNKL